MWPITGQYGRGLTTAKFGLDSIQRQTELMMASARHGLKCWGWFEAANIIPKHQNLKMGSLLHSEDHNLITPRCGRRDGRAECPRTGGSPIERSGQQACSLSQGLPYEGRLKKPRLFSLEEILKGGHDKEYIKY